MEIDSWLARATARQPEAVALETPDERLTYRELLMAATRGAGRLVSRGATPGDRVAITLPAGRAFVVAFHACLLLRAPAMPIDPRLGERERKDLVRGADAEFLVSSPLPDDSGSPYNVVDPGEDEVALVVHTSGTTRAPRPVALTYGNIAAHIRAAGAVLGTDADERWLCPMPLSHVGGLMILARSAAAAGTVVLEPFDAERTAKRLQDGDITLASLVPTMLARILDAGGRPGPRLRRIMLGGGPVAPALLRRAADAGFPVSQTYGLTEACSTVTLAEPGDLETAGHALPGTGLTIAGDGEILVSGPTVVGEWDALRTGDLGRLDDQSRLTVIGRKSDTIVTGGENVAPAEVEAVLEEHPGVAEAAVFAREHPLWGESVTALVVAAGEPVPSAADLREHCASRLAGYKVPKTFELVTRLPRTPSGKLLRRELT